MSVPYRSPFRVLSAQFVFTFGSRFDVLRSIRDPNLNTNREASTTYGQIGVKVWLYKGERLVPRVGRDEEYRDRGPRRPPQERRA